MGLWNQALDHFCTFFSGKDGMARLEFPDLELYLIFLRLPNIGRVRNYEIKKIASQTSKQVCFAKLNARCELVARGIGFCNLKRGSRKIGGINLGFAKLFCQG